MKNIPNRYGVNMKQKARLVATLSVVWLLSGLTFAQEFRATLGGRVMDAQGAIVPGAKISVVNQESRSRTETVSGPDGFYIVPFLAPGLYTITIESPSFKRSVREGIRLSVNDRATVDAMLEVGAVNEQVTVNAEASLVQSATASTAKFSQHGRYPICRFPAGPP